MIVCLACSKVENQHVSAIRVKNSQKFLYNGYVHKCKRPEVSFLMPIYILFCICLTCLNQTQQWKRWIWPLTFQTNQYKSSTAWCFSALAPDNWSEILETNWTVEQLIHPGAGSELLTTATTLEASVSSCRRQRGMLPCWLSECTDALNSTKSWRCCYKKSLLITTYFCVNFLENTNYFALKVLCIYICVCVFVRTYIKYIKAV